jgi:nicotinamidase/pyrazinamidase
MTRALLVVDVQNDYCPRGAVAVRNADTIVPVVNRLMSRVDHVAATQDWHPPDHGCFVTSHPGRSVHDVIDLNGVPQLLWPPHCVRGTLGAELHPALELSRIERVFKKGMDPNVDSYSGFRDNGGRHTTGLLVWLAKRRVREVWVCGLATEYCVRHTALDAASLGFRTAVVEDACCGLEVQPGDVQRTLAELAQAGVRIVAAKELVEANPIQPRYASRGTRPAEGASGL